MQVILNGITHTLYERGPRGDAVLFLHYFGGSGSTWQAVMQHLPATYCVAPDLRGFGGTDAPPTGYTLATYADDVAAIVDHFQLRRVLLVGHSMGGKIALTLAARRPAALQAVLLIAPSPPTPEPIADAERARLLMTHGDRSAALETITKITASTLPTPLRERAITDALRTSQVAWRAWLQHGSRENITAQMAQIQGKVVILAGAHDPVISAQLIDHELVPYLTGASTERCVVPGVGHLVPLEAPQAVAQLIGELIC